MKKQNRKSWTMAYCGMAAALCVALMLLGGRQLPYQFMFLYGFL